ncbi:hypothetical protein JCM4814A_79740 [Streptomyces phaeofaciens JCM 4814]|uniref:Transposase IS110-like N-terminal domain-containing protein n=1 Tax=Streptomyces phaeofaciens TaxID=68254 RepID=A0A918M124_9ACTN|nr:hypothetical protein GCM10010226_82900 [Streptomyces phaeofaciens]
MTWGIDLADGGAALAITILLNHDQPLHYIFGRAIHRASESYRGEGKTDAKDAAVIADQVRIRRDLQRLRTGDETVTDLKILRPGERRRRSGAGGSSGAIRSHRSSGTRSARTPDTLPTKIAEHKNPWPNSF